MPSYAPRGKTEICVRGTFARVNRELRRGRNYPVREKENEKRKNGSREMEAKRERKQRKSFHRQTIKK